MNIKLCTLITFSCFSLWGCSLGKDSILFVTKTSVAIDVDTNPLTFDVGYGRYEGSIAPVAEDGEILPLLASVNAESTISSDVFGAGVSQNFGVGNAAVIMTQYLGSDSNPIDNGSVDFSELISKPASIKGKINDNTRRYFFGTKTTLGFTTSFAPERGYMPDSITLGYKRKELAYVPIKQNLTAGTLSIPSMIATTGNSENAGINESGFSISQFYATGKAASYLAANPTIRNSVITKIIGDDEVIKKLNLEIKANNLTKLNQQRVDSLIQSIDKLTDSSAHDLASSPPVKNEEITDLIKLRDPNNLRATNPIVAKNILKMQLVYFQRDENNMKLWESAILALPKK